MATEELPLWDVRLMTYLGIRTERIAAETAAQAVWKLKTCDDMQLRRAEVIEVVRAE